MWSASWRGKQNICREEGALPSTEGMAHNIGSVGDWDEPG